LRAQLIDGGEQFVILTDKILGAHGEKLLVEGVSSLPWTSAPMTLHNQ